MAARPVERRSTPSGTGEPQVEPRASVRRTRGSQGPALGRRRGKGGWRLWSAAPSPARVGLTPGPAVPLSGARPRAQTRQRTQSISTRCREQERSEQPDPDTANTATGRRPVGRGKEPRATPRVHLENPAPGKAARSPQLTNHLPSKRASRDIREDRCRSAAAWCWGAGGNGREAWGPRCLFWVEPVLKWHVVMGRIGPNTREAGDPWV